ncbi:gamma-glutamyl phosphate reductase [Mycena olivaceomarginata]|nr:gamma-glutamyl phosphate reductase [Mycena olivaceomarginata]
MSESLLKRLDLDKGDKWDSMLQGVLDVAALSDPLGIVSYAKELDDGLELYRVSCPIGVLLVIFEARPEVVVNIAALAIKSGRQFRNSEGRKRIQQNDAALAQAIAAGLSQSSLPDTYVQSIQTRAEVSSLLALDQYIDLVIPRGSNSLVQNIQNNTRIPVMGHADGICSVYLDESADTEKAVRVVLDSKTDYPSACNSTETLIVHESLLNSVWPVVGRALLEANVRLLCDPRDAECPPIFPYPSVQPLPRWALHSRSLHHRAPHPHPSPSLRSPSLPRRSPLHQRALLPPHRLHRHRVPARRRRVLPRPSTALGRSSTLATRFADGFRYGFGTEVGISTGRIHARGPVGLEGLVIYKYMLRSTGATGHIVGDFGAGGRQYKHADIAPTLPF